MTQKIGQRKSASQITKAEAEVGRSSAGLLMSRHVVTPLDNQFFGKDVPALRRGPERSDQSSGQWHMPGGIQGEVEENKKCEEDKAQILAAEKERIALAEGPDRKQHEQDEQEKKEQDKALKKAQREKSLKDLKKKPAYQAQRWLVGVAKLIAECKVKCGVAKKAKKLPAGTNVTYTQKFAAHCVVLEKLERQLRDSMSKPKDLKSMLDAANQAVADVKEDVRAFNLLYRGYYKDQDKEK